MSRVESGGSYPAYAALSTIDCLELSKIPHPPVVPSVEARRAGARGSARNTGVGSEIFTLRYNHRMADTQINESEDRPVMTEAQWAILRAATEGFGDQDENGIDLSRLRANLKLTPLERLRRHQKALELVREVRRAGIAAGISRHSQNS